MAIGRLTSHAKQRMRLRKVAEREVDEVLLRPDSAQFDPDEDSYRLERKLEKGTLKVWVVSPWPPIGKIVVKSVAWKGR